MPQCVNNRMEVGKVNASLKETQNTQNENVKANSEKQVEYNDNTEEVSVQEKESNENKNLQTEE